MDTFGQCEVVNGRIVVSINNRISKMPGVKYGTGVAHVTKWHESFHVATDLSTGQTHQQLSLPGIEGAAERIIVCRNARPTGSVDGREFIAENAAIAAAIAQADLDRCPDFRRFQLLCAKGGDLSGTGWSLLYGVAETIEVIIRRR